MPNHYHQIMKSALKMKANKQGHKYNIFQFNGSINNSYFCLLKAAIFYFCQTILMFPNV